MLSASSIASSFETSPSFSLCSYRAFIIFPTSGPGFKSNNFITSSPEIGGRKFESSSFSQDEYLYAKQSNFSSVSLGDNILRVETAAIAAISYIKIINNSKNL